MFQGAKKMEKDKKGIIHEILFLNKPQKNHKMQ